jgi:hypothetical protein
MKDFDITYNKHHGNPQSNEAYEANKRIKSRQRRAIIDYIRSCGIAGATADEISQALSYPLHTTSARCSELKADGVAVKVGTRRTRLGCAAGVLVVEPSIEWGD